MTDLNTLASMVEAATGPDAMLDLAVFQAVTGEAGIVKCQGREGISARVPAYSASLDAAMTLVPAERDRLDILEAAIESARDAQDGVYYLPLHITASALRSRAAMGEG